MKTTQNAFLLLNGVTPKTLPDLSNYAIVCATDGAYKFLEENQIKPDFISGDFDSSESLPEHTEIIHTPDQNYTDFDKALQILYKKGITCVDIYGASGKEQDHFLGNLHTARIWGSKLKLTFFDNYGYYFLAEKKTELKQVLHQTISLFPFPKAKKITTTGLKYPLIQETLSLKKRIGTRNVAIASTVFISFTSGHLFVFVNTN